MTDQPLAPASDSAPAPVASNQAEGHSPSDLGRMLAQLRHAKQEDPAESAEPATAAPEIPAQAEIAAPETAPGEAPEAIEPASEPPIEPPRSWTKEARERWNTLPREAQEEFARIEQSRERELRRSQNEAAEQRKAIEAERQAAEQARKQYEAKLPALMEALQRQSQFSDIRTLDDVKRLQSEDPFRFQAWQVHQMDMQAVEYERRQAEERQAQETARQTRERKQREHELLLEKAPEYADPVKLAAAQKDAVDYLRSKGFSDDRLAELAAHPIADDHAFQLVILDGLKFQAAQKANAAAKAKLAEKPVPPVQRPGTAKPPGAAGAETIQNLSAKLEQSRNPRALADLIGAMRSGS